MPSLSMQTISPVSFTAETDDNNSSSEDSSEEFFCPCSLTARSQPNGQPTQDTLDRVMSHYNVMRLQENRTYRATDFLSRRSSVEATAPNGHKSSSNSNGSPLEAAPEGALSDIVIPNVFTGGIFADANIDLDEKEEDPRVWVPQTDCLSFRPLCFCISQGYYVNLLKFKGGGVLGCHRHPSPVHALTLKGSWGYKEHGWNAKPGTYVFEPPGETHTLIVDEDCDEMVAMFHGT